MLTPDQKIKLLTAQQLWFEKMGNRFAAQATKRAIARLTKGKIMNEMIERVANAIYAAFQAPGLTGEPQTIATLSPNYAEMYRKQARAAIAAMREPTEKMENAGFAGIEREEIGDDTCRRIWRAMIDDALESNPKPRS